MADILNWGLLSTAGINQAVINPIKLSPRSRLVAVASRDGDRARAYALDHGIPIAHTGYDALLEDPNVDVIYNPLPNLMHAEWTIKAADAGKHVLCEKPLVTTLADFDAVAAAAARNNVTVFEAFMYLHHPQTLKLRDLVQSGALGKLQMINSWFHFYLPPAKSDNIRLNKELHGGGFWDVGVYPNSLAVMINGGEAPVEAFATQQIGETGVDVLLNAHLRFADGTVAQISSGLRQHRSAATFVVGDAGAATLATPWKPDLDGPNGIAITYRDREDEVLKNESVDPYICEIRAMEACVLDGAAPVVPLELSRNFLRSALAIYESARVGRVVEVE